MRQAREKIFELQCLLEQARAMGLMEAARMIVLFELGIFARIFDRTEKILREYDQDQ